MTPLSHAQRTALAFIAGCPRKSGGFYADFGHRATTLSSLHSRGLLQTENAPIIGAPIYRATWSLTDAGKKEAGTAP